MELTEILKSPRFKIPRGLLDEIRQYLIVGTIPLLDWNDAESVRGAQGLIVQMESRLDRIVSVQHDAKRVLQQLGKALASVRVDLQAQGVISAKMSGPQVDRELERQIPGIYNLLSRWQLVEELCRDAQKRLETAKDTVKFLAKLDDNLRWATSRNL